MDTNASLHLMWAIIWTKGFGGKSHIGFDFQGLVINRHTPLSQEVQVPSKLKFTCGSSTWAFIHNARSQLADHWCMLRRYQKDFTWPMLSHFQYLFSLQSSNVRRDVDYSTCFSLHIIDVCYNSKGSDIIHSRSSEWIHISIWVESSVSGHVHTQISSSWYEGKMSYVLQINLCFMDEQSHWSPIPLHSWVDWGWLDPASNLWPDCLTKCHPRHFITSTFS